MKLVSLSSLFALLTLFILATIGCGGVNDTVHAASATPAILSGYCNNSNLPTAYMTNMGGSDICNSLTGTPQTGVPIPSAGTLQNLRVMSASTGSVWTVLVNGTATEITCTIPGTGSAVPGSVCSDTQHSRALNGGDLVTIQATTTLANSVVWSQVSLEKQ